MDADDFCEILLNAKRKAEEDKLFFRWCLLEVHNFGEPISFSHYKEHFKPKKHKTTKEIMLEQQEILEMFNDGYQKVELF